jgi:hypothetical protein
MIVFGSSRGGLQQVAAVGGVAEPLTVVEEGTEVTHRTPALLPDGRGVLFTAFDGSANEGSVLVGAPELETPKLLVPAGKAPWYAPTGHLLFFREHTLMAAPFDLELLELTAPAVPVVEEVDEPRPRAGAQYTLAQDGTLAYLPGSETTKAMIVWVDEDGSTEPISANELDFRSLSLSPAGDRIAVTVAPEGSGMDGPDGELWIVELARDVPRRLTREAHDRAPAWSPDGRWIAFCSDRHGGEHNIYRMRPDPTSQPERLTTGDHDQDSPAWSPDGRTLAFTEQGDILFLRFDDEGQVIGESEVMPVPPDTHEDAPAFSPDGAWIAYTSNESGPMSVYVRDATGAPPGVRVSNEAGWGPIWSPTENRLYYWSWQDTAMKSVSYATDGDVFVPGSPERAIEFQRGELIVVTCLTPDASRFAGVALPGIGRSSAEITFVLNWFEELVAKVSPAE